MNVYLLTIDLANYKHIEYFTSLSNLIYSIIPISQEYINSEVELLIEDSSKELHWGTLINYGCIKDVLTNLDYEFNVYKLKISR